MLAMLRVEIIFRKRVPLVVLFGEVGREARTRYRIVLSIVPFYVNKLISLWSSFGRD